MAINVHSAKVTLKQLPNELLFSFKPTTTWHWLQNSNHITTTNIVTPPNSKVLLKAGPRAQQLAAQRPAAHNGPATHRP